MAISQTLQQVMDLVAEVAPSYTFLYANLNMANVRVDDAQFPLCYCEEVQSQTYQIGAYGGITKRTRIELYFLKRAPMQGEALQRNEIRAEIEQEAVVPFIKALYDRFGTLDTIQSETPPPLFDDNDVAVSIVFNWEEPIC